MSKRKRKKKDGSKKEVKYQGVQKRVQKKGRGRYQARIRIDGKRQTLGTFDTPKEAAQAYDRAAIEAGYPTSKLNFLDQVPKEYNPKKKKLLSTNTTGFRGVHKEGNRFKAQSSIDGKKHTIGRFDTAKEAAEAWDQAALQAKFPRCELNFPDLMKHDKKVSEEEVEEEELEDEAKDQDQDQDEEEVTPPPKKKTCHSSSTTTNFDNVSQQEEEEIIY